MGKPAMKYKTDPEYSDFERGERQALLQVRSFIAKHGLKEADAFCQQRLHDIMMDARQPEAERKA